MNNVAISVIVPVYNVEKYLAKCIDSILNQTFKDFELICVDDCSTDNSLEILNQYAEKDDKIKIIHLEKNLKQGGARNAGLDIAKGKYIAFVDADDYIAPTLLEKMYKASERNYCDLVVTNVENVLEENSEQLTELRERLNYKDTELNTGFYVIEPYSKRLRISPYAKLYRRDIIEKHQIKFPQNLVQEDVAFYWFYIPYVSNLYYINENLYIRLLHKNSTMYQLQYEQKRISDHVKVIKIAHDYLIKNKLYDLYKESFINYVKGVLDYVMYVTQKDFVLKVALFMPEIIPYFLDDFKLMKQLLVSHKKRIAFWGASIYLEEFLLRYKINNENIVGIIDKDSKKWGKQVAGLTIYSPEQIKELGIQTILFTVKHNNVYSSVKDYLAVEYPSVKLLPNIFTVLKNLHRPSIPKMNLSRVSIHLTEHCNLNCKGCNNFSPLAKEQYVDIKNYESDIKRLADITNKRIKRIYLMGGEPLLHPNIIDILKMSRLHLPNTRLTILTNGILLPNQTEVFWNTCHEYNIAIEVTKYPINIDFNKIEEIAKNFDVEYGYFCNTGQIIKTSNSYPIDVNGKQNKVKAFNNCECANLCLFLKQGRIYTCAIAPNIEHFNKHFGYKIPLTSKDGIDIYKAKSEKEIMKFLAKPIPFCKYCNIEARTYGEPWSVSKKDINEWI